MKKIIALIVLIVIGIVSTSLYIGANTKGTIQKYINLINKSYNIGSMPFKATLEDYQTQGFSSAIFKLNITLPDQRPYNMVLKKPITLEYQAEYGPIFWKNGFGFGKVKITARQKLEDILLKQVIIDKLILNKPIFFNENVVIGFNNSFSLLTSLEALDISDLTKENSLLTSPITMTANFNKELVGEFKLNIDSVVLGASSKQGAFSLEGLEVDINVGEEIFEGISLSNSIKQEIKVDKTSFSIIGIPVSIKMAHTFSLKADDGYAKVESDSVIEFIEKLEILHNLNKLTFESSFSGLSKEIFEGLKLINDLAVAKNTKNRTKVKQDILAVSKLIEANLFQKDKTKLKLKIQADFDEDRKIEASLKVTYVGDNPDELAKLIKDRPVPVEGLLKLFKIEFDLSVNKQILDKIIPITITNRITERDFIDKKTDSYKVNFQQENGNFILNGKKLTTEEFIAAILPAIR